MDESKIEEKVKNTSSSITTFFKAKYSNIKVY